MAAPLRPCTGCERHVRANVTTCPFCNASLAIDDSEPTAPTERLGRAARMAFSGAAAMAITVGSAGCGKDNRENIAMPYGAPPETATAPLAPVDDAAPPVGSATTMAIATAPDAAAMDAPDASADAGAKKKAAPALSATTKHMNMNKPYGAPPADGYGIFEA